MDKKFFIALAIGIAFVGCISSCASSRMYKPLGDIEKMHYIKVNKDIWPDDLRNNGIANYSDKFIGWVGIVEEYKVENNIIQFTIKHHYYDWVEDFGYSKGPILLSPDGEGYIIGNHVFEPDITEDVIREAFKNLVGDCIIIYGYPKEILDDGKIVIDTKYSRNIPKKYVDPSWIAPGFSKYGRNGLE
jgi:hypothetical protein